MKTLIVAGLVLICTVFSAEIAEARHPSRIRLLAHGNLQVADDVKLMSRFIPSGNLIGDLAPIFFLGVEVPVLDGKLKLQPHLAWNFGIDEPIGSLSTALKFDPFWGWTDIEISLPSNGAYWFAMMEYPLHKWLHIGLEAEGWGDWTKLGSSSYGGGTNLLLRFERYGVDLAAHERKLGDAWDYEFFLRIHYLL